MFRVILTAAAVLTVAGCAATSTHPTPAVTAGAPVVVQRARRAPPAKRPVARPRVLRVIVSAHRGGAGQWPQDSLLAFRDSLHAGYDEIEADAWITSDGVAVIYHDDTISPDRCPGRYAGRNIWTLTAAQIRTVRCQGQPIPTEQQLVNLVADSPNQSTVLRLEAKTRPGLSDRAARAQAEQVGRMVANAGLTRRAIMQDFDWAGIAGFHAASPALRVSALIGDPNRADVWRAAWLGAWDLSYNAAYSTAALNKAIAAAGLVPTVWGVDGVPNQPGHALPGAARAAVRFARHVEQQGVRVVITNYPGVVRAALG